ncbi:type II toxin-antitoxin system RelE/ParE family toxin [Peptococcaceae bacterium]|nr:type II toxin-antitoxin system RelE/ParE family toxin [Peptococcaceae bacterium]
MWQIEYIKETLNDLIKLDNSQRIKVLKAIKKVSQNPLSKLEGGYGKPLGNKGSTRLSGYFKIKLLKLGIRVIYKVIREKDTMRIIIIYARTDDEVYITAGKRIIQK